jgi:DNA-binding beta-propeller fold protein YncE
LPDVKGRIDHLAYDSANHLAFIAALGNNSVEIVNIETKKIVHTIPNLHEPQGIFYIPSLQRLVVANGGDGKCIFFDAKTFTQIHTVNLKDDADNIRFNSETNELYAGYGNGSISIIDANEMKQKASIALDGHPESFQLDKKKNRLYINVPDAKEIQVADLKTNQIVANWKNTVAFSNFPMALDEVNDPLFIGCRNSAKLWVVDTKSGKDITALNCSGDTDDVFYNSNDSLVFLSAGKGFIDVFKATTNEYHIINRIKTRSGARTSLWLSSEKKLLLAVPGSNGNPAALWVYGFN